MVLVKVWLVILVLLSSVIVKLTADFSLGEGTSCH